MKRAFSKSGYISIIHLAKKNGYTISSAQNAIHMKKNHSPILILRHDVDFYLEAALAMAELEKKIGVRSTYFILLYSNYYSPLSPDGRGMIKKISSLSHEIGIHWDSRDYPENFERRFKRDLGILSEIIGKKIISGSQHQPTSSPLMRFSSTLHFEAYRDFQDFIYISDSLMRWRQFSPWKLIEKKRDVQFLAHPFWWMVKGKTIREKFLRYRLELFKKNKKDLIKELKNFNHFLKNRKVKDAYFGYKK